MTTYSIITGSTGLLGEQHVIALAEKKHGLILIDLNEKKLKLQVSKIKKQFKGSVVNYFVCDITNENQIINLKNILKKKRIIPDVLINNAALNPKMKKFSKTSKTGTIENYDVNFLKKEINVNLIGPFLMIKHFGPAMAQKKTSSIINIGSDLSVNAPDQSVYHKSENINKVRDFKPIGYSLSKFGIIGLTKYVATYWGHKNLRCNALVLGAVENKQPSFLKKNVSKRIPLGRWAKKNEYKKAIQFLSSNDSSYMTGQMLIMDGGRSSW